MIILVCLLLLLGPIFAHVSGVSDDGRLLEILNWLPMGDYDEVALFDIDAFKTAQAGMLLGPGMNANSIQKKLSELLSPQLAKGVRTLASGRRVRYLKAGEAQTTGGDGTKSSAQAGLSPIVLDFVNQDGRRIRQEYQDSAEEFTLAFYDNAVQAVEFAKNANEVQKTDSKYHGIDIYSGMSKQRIGFYLAVMDPQLIVSAKTMNNLKEIMDAGSGAALSLIDDKTIAGIASLQDKFGQLWIIRDTTHRYRFEYERALESGAPDTTISVLKKKIEDVAIKDILSWQFLADKVIEVRIQVYADKDAAAKALSRERAAFLKQHSPKESKTATVARLDELYIKNTTYKADGAVLITEVVRDRAFLELESKRR